MATEREWNASIEITHELGAERALRVLERMQQTLQRYAAAGAAGPTSLDVLLSVDADSPTTALTKGLRAFLSALVRARGDKGAEIVSVAIELPEHLERRLEQQNQITLVGIRELADLLGVTRQRASQIAAMRTFPAPLAKLAAGPVWNKASLTWFLEDWAREPRRPGPKPGSRRRPAVAAAATG